MFVYKSVYFCALNFMKLHNTSLLFQERLKREVYQAELRMQIEEKRRMAALRDEQERREQELENRRLEQQLLRMQEEELMEQRRSRRDEQVRNGSFNGDANYF